MDDQGSRVVTCWKDAHQATVLWAKGMGLARTAGVVEQRQDVAGTLSGVARELVLRMETQNETAGVPSREVYRGNVVDALAARIGCDRGDAEGLVMANESIVAEGWEQQREAGEVAGRVDRASLSA